MKLTKNVLQKIKEVSETFEYYNFTGERVPAAMIESKKYQVLISSIINQIIFDNLSISENNFTNYEIDIENYIYEDEKGNKATSLLLVQAIKTAWIKLDMKRKTKNQIHNHLYEVSDEELNQYLWQLFNYFKDNNLIKQKYKLEKFAKNYKSLVNRAEKEYHDFRANEMTKRVGLLGMIMKKNNKSKSKKDKISPVNTFLIEYILVTFTNIYGSQIAKDLKNVIDKL